MLARDVAAQRPTASKGQRRATRRFSHTNQAAAPSSKPVRPVKEHLRDVVCSSQPEKGSEWTSGRYRQSIRAVCTVRVGAVLAAAAPTRPGTSGRGFRGWLRPVMHVSDQCAMGGCGVVVDGGGDCRRMAWLSQKRGAGRAGGIQATRRPRPAYEAAFVMTVPPPVVQQKIGFW